MNRFIIIVAVSLLVVCAFGPSTPVCAAQIENNIICKITDTMVVTADQYRELISLGFESGNLTLEKEYIWFNSPYQKMPFQFDAAAWIRGLISGTSLIPPNKVKEFLTADS